MQTADQLPLFSVIAGSSLKPSTSGLTVTRLFPPLQFISETDPPGCSNQQNPNAGFAFKSLPCLLVLSVESIQTVSRSSTSPSTLWRLLRCPSSWTIDSSSSHRIPCSPLQLAAWNPTSLPWSQSQLVVVCRMNLNDHNLLGKSPALYSRSWSLPGRFEPWCAPTVPLPTGYLSSV